jgi:hypothetical protein
MTAQDKKEELKRAYEHVKRTLRVEILAKGLEWDRAYAAVKPALDAFRRKQWKDYKSEAYVHASNEYDKANEILLAFECEMAALKDEEKANRESFRKKMQGLK